MSTSMKAPGAWPDASDILLYANNSGIAVTNSDIAVAERSVHGIVAEFERRTRWYPFLSTGEDETRLFDAPFGEILDLDAGLISASSLAVAGQAYEAGVNYWLQPNNASQQGRPYTVIDFNPMRENGYFRQYGQYGYGPGMLFYGAGRQTISITGIWGYALAVPFDVAQAVIGKALTQVLRFAGMRLSGGVQKWSTTDASETYGDSPYQGAMTMMNADFDAAVTRYRRLQVA